MMVSSISRAALLDFLGKSLALHGKALILADSGMGKTVLCSQIADGFAGQAYYLSLLPLDSDASRLHCRMLALWSDGSSQTSDALLAAGDHPQTLARSLADSLRQRHAHDPTLLILDDLHRIDADSHGMAMLQHLATMLSAHASLILASRPHSVDLTARFGLAREAVIDNKALALAPDEHRRLALDSTSDLPAAILRVPLHAALASQGVRRPADVPAWLRQALPRSALPALELVVASGETRMDRIAEVLGGTGASLLLSRASSLPGFHCRDGRVILHDWLLDALREHALEFLPSHRLKGLCQRIAALHMRNGEIVEALALYLKLGDYDAAERLLRSHGARLIGLGMHRALLMLLQPIPEPERANRPALLVTYGTVLSNLGRLEARDHLLRAIELTESLEDPAFSLLARIRLLEFEGGIAGGYEHLERLTRESEQLLEACGEELPPSALGWIHAILGAAYQLGYADFDRAHHHLTRASRIAAEHDLANLQALVGYFRAHRHMSTGQFEIAWKHLDDLHALRRAGRLGGMYHNLLFLGGLNLLLNCGRLEALEAHMEAVRSPRAWTGYSPLVRAFLARWQAEGLLARGLAERAVALLETALGETTAISDFNESMLRQVLAMALAASGDPEGARRQSELAQALRRDCQEVHQLGYQRLSLAVAHYLAGDSATAREQATLAFESGRATRKPMVQAAALFLQALLHGHRRAAPAAEAARHGLAIMERHDFDFLPSWHPDWVRPFLTLCHELGVDSPLLESLAAHVGLSISADEGPVPLLRLQTLGTLALSGHQAVMQGKALTERQRALLALLASQPGLQMSHELARTRLYPDSPDDKARQSLDTLINRLRRSMDQHFGKGAGRRYLRVAGGMLSLEHCRVDALDFAQGVERLRTLTHADAMARIEFEGLPQRLFRLHGGPFCAEVTDLEDVDAMRDRLDELHGELQRLARELLPHLLQPERLESLIPLALRGANDEDAGIDRAAADLP